jgi:hypothetical protein
MDAGSPPSATPGTTLSSDFLGKGPVNGGDAKMQASYLQTGRYYAPSNLPRQWPMPAGAYDREAGLRAFRVMVERSRYAEEVGFD